MPRTRLLSQWRPRYDQVGTDYIKETKEDRDDNPTPNSSSVRWIMSTRREIAYLAGSLSTFFILLFVGIIVTTHAPTTSTTTTTTTTTISTDTTASVRLCGNTPSEAIALGCNWNQLLWAWFPAHCPSYANDQYLAYHDWKYWADPSGAQELIGENLTLALGDKGKKIWTQRGEHMSHCVFFFLGFAEAAMGDGAIPPKLNDYRHMKHCAGMLLSSLRKDEDWDNIDTLTPKAGYDEHC